LKLDSVYSRIAVVFAAVLIGFGVLLGWLSYTAAKYHQHEVMQQVSRGLAAHIASQGPLLQTNGLDRIAVDALFRMARAVNPSIELYLLDPNGEIVSYSQPDLPLAQKRVALAPIRAFLDGDPLPVLGDSPRNAARREIFSAAPIVVDGRAAGYVYVVLVADMYRQMAEEARQDYALRTALWIGAAALGLALLVGLTAFAWITRPLNSLTRAVQTFEQGNFADRIRLQARPVESNDEIRRLSTAFEHMADRLAAQVTELKRQDNLRRELVANVSHDLRTPLTSMQNYLETLLRTGDALPVAERQQYLEVAVRQIRRVARLSQQLFELARLECEETLPQPEVFSLSELLQDIAQKFALAASDKGVRLRHDARPEGFFVRGDIGMIERVIANLIENAIRHTPAGGEIRLDAVRAEGGIEILVTDTGVGIAAADLPDLFKRDSPLRQTSRRAGGGLGLQIARRILALHGTQMRVASEPGRGTTFRFALSPAPPG
jgi:signal transduction histidine kinase